MFEIRDLQHLLSLDEHRHFGRAAAAVGLSQPALTKSLQRLERILDTRLFDRSRARVSPTAVGEEVIAQARKLVAAASDLKRTVGLMTGAAIGSTSIGIGPAMSESYVSEAIAIVAQNQPQTQIIVRVDHWHQLSEWLLAGQLDFYVADIEQAMRDTRFEFTPLASQPFVWFCRSDHPLADLAVVRRVDLLNYPIATPRMPTWAKDWFAAAIEPGQASGKKSAFPSVECDNYAMLKKIVLAGTSVSAALPSSIESELQKGLFKILPLQAPELTTHAGIVRLKDRTLSPMAVALIAQIVRLAESG